MAMAPGTLASGLAPHSLGDGGQPPELFNIASSLEEKELLEIGNLAWREYKEDLTTRTEWLEMHAHWINLYYHRDKPLNPPWNGSSQEGVPMLAEACNQFHARAVPAFFPGSVIVKAIPTGNITDLDLKRAERVSKHLSWQLLSKDLSYKKRKDALLLGVVLHGSFFTKTFWDGQNVVVENVRAEDLVLPYSVGPREIEKVERKTQLIWMSVNDSKIHAQGGFFLHAAEAYQQPDPKPTTAAIDQAMGIQPGVRRDYSDALLLEQHRLLDLDDDGIAEPYIVTLDAQTQKVLRIAIRYEVDETGYPTDGKKPIEYFTHYQFLPNPDGVYGLGMGHLIAQINTAVNKMMRQTVDAGTLQNTKSGFVNDSLGVKKGEVVMSMGKFVPVPMLTSRIQDNIQEFQFSPPSQAIVAMMELLMSRGDRLATVTEALTGQTEQVMQPTTILSLVDQAMKVFSASFDRLIDSWSEELRKIYRLNGKYLSDQEYVTILDAYGLERFQIGRKDYAADLQIVPIADPKMSSAQRKMAKAQAEWQFLSQNPLVLQSPTHFYEASRRYLESIETENINAVLPRPVTDPMRVDDPKIENMGAMMPNPVIPNVYADQDHMTHLMEHEAIKVDPVFSGRLTPRGLQMLELHIQLHAAYMYGVRNAGLGAVLAGPMGSGAMAAQPGYVMVPPQLGGQVPTAGPVEGGGQPPAPGAPPGANGGAGLY